MQHFFLISNTLRTSAKVGGKTESFVAPAWRRHSNSQWSGRQVSHTVWWAFHRLHLHIYIWHFSPWPFNNYAGYIHSFRSFVYSVTFSCKIPISIYNADEVGATIIKTKQLLGGLTLVWFSVPVVSNTNGRKDTVVNKAHMWCLFVKENGRLQYIVTCLIQQY